MLVHALPWGSNPVVLSLCSRSSAVCLSLYSDRHVLLLDSLVLVQRLLPLVAHLLQASIARGPVKAFEALCYVFYRVTFGAQVIVELSGCVSDDELLEICDHPSRDSGVVVTSWRAPPSEVVPLFLWHTQCRCGAGKE